MKNKVIATLLILAAFLFKFMIWVALTYIMIIVLYNIIKYIKDKNHTTGDY